MCQIEIKLTSEAPTEKQIAIKNYLQWCVDQPDFKDEVRKEVIRSLRGYEFY